MRLIYTAGPMSAPTAWEVEKNIRAAEEVALQILKMGAAVFCPATQGRFYQGELPWEEWIKRDLEVLDRCDAIFMLLNWKDSKGATAEYDYAKAHGIPRLFGLGEVAIFLKEHS